MAYITQAELEYAIGSATMTAIFDDDNDGLPEDHVIDAYIARASALVDAWIGPVYSGPFPIAQTPVPSMIRELTIQYTLALAYERRPEYTQTLGSENKFGDRWARADEIGKRLQAAVLRIPDYIAQPKPANVGGIVFDNARRVIVDSSDGTSNRGDF